MHFPDKPEFLRLPVKGDKGFQRLHILARADIDGFEIVEAGVLPQLRGFVRHIAGGRIGEFRFKNRIGAARLMKPFDDFPEGYDPADLVHFIDAEVQDQPPDIVAPGFRKRAFPADQHAFVSVAERFYGGTEPLLHSVQAVQYPVKPGNLPVQPFCKPLRPAAFG